MAKCEDIEVTWPVLSQRESYANLGADVPQLARAPAPQRSSALSTAVGEADAQRGGFEYLDHTADVQIHAWGPDMKVAFGAAAVGMFGYMVEMEDFGVELARTVTATGHDWQSMFFAFLDECLYVFHTEALVMCRVAVQSINTETWKVTASVRGGLFDATRDKQGTEVKAITYSNMQIHQVDSESTRGEPLERRAQVYVIVDI